jgi:NAD(P)-dependent dehydrogenase (short-subunit alcohol dehydrogenase family)
MTSSAGLRKVLITGAGSGFGHEVAIRLAEKGFDVIASVEVDSYRNLEPKSMIEETKRLQEAPWQRKATDGRSAARSTVTRQPV